MITKDCSTGQKASNSVHRLSIGTQDHLEVALCMEFHGYAGGSLPCYIHAIQASIVTYDPIAAIAMPLNQK